MAENISLLSIDTTSYLSDIEGGGVELLASTQNTESKSVISIPNNEIWYTTIDNNVCEINTGTISGVNANVLSNTYENGKGIIRLGETGNTSTKRNYWAKKFMLDWNSIKSGTVTCGYDKDGLYYGIKENNLYNISGGYDAEKKEAVRSDIFDGKIKFKENTQYTIRVKWKLIGEYNANGVYFGFKYTTGELGSFYCKQEYTSITESTFTSYIGRTVKNIYASYGTYGADKYTAIYDISLTEGADVPTEWIVAEEDKVYGGENETLCGGTNENTIIPYSKSNYNTITLLENAKNNETYVFSCTYSKVLSGSTSKFTILVFRDNNEGGYLYYELPVGKFVSQTITIPSTGNWAIRLNSGVGGSTSGISMQFSNVMLQKGTIPLDIQLDSNFINETSNVETMILPSTVSYLVGQAFSDPRNVKELTFTTITPPEFDYDSLYFFSTDNTVDVYVPEDSVSAYETALYDGAATNVNVQILPTELEYSYKTWASSLSYPLLETTTMPWSLTETALKTGNLMCYKYSGDTANSEYGNNHVEAFFIFKASTINVERTKVELMRIDYLDNEGNILETHGSQYDGKEVITSVKNTTEYGVASGVALYKGISDSPFKGCTENHYILRIPIQNYYYPSTSECTKRKLTFRMTFQSVDEEIKLKQELAVMQIGSQLVD